MSRPILVAEHLRARITLLEPAFREEMIARMEEVAELPIQAFERWSMSEAVPGALVTRYMSTVHENKQVILYLREAASTESSACLHLIGFDEVIVDHPSDE